MVPLQPMAFNAFGAVTRYKRIRNRCLLLKLNKIILEMNITLYNYISVSTRRLV